MDAFKCFCAKQTYLFDFLNVETIPFCSIFGRPFLENHSSNEEIEVSLSSMSYITFLKNIVSCAASQYPSL